MLGTTAKVPSTWHAESTSQLRVCLRAPRPNISCDIDIFVSERAGPTD